MGGKIKKCRGGVAARMTLLVLAKPLSFRRDFVSVTRDTGGVVQSRKRFDTQGPDESLFYGLSAGTTDAIKSFTNNGFVVGDSQDVGAAQSHFYVAFKSTPPVPALSAGALALLAVAIGGAALGARMRKP